MIEENVKKIDRLVELFPEPRRSKVKKMLEGQVGMSFYTSPASAREDYHDCYAGGLAAHSLEVVANLNTISKSLAPGGFDGATLAFVGLFHDLGKTGDGERDGYVPNPSDSGRQRGFLFEINRACRYAPSSERGLYILQRHGIELSFEEWQAIRLNDGQYTPENKGYAMREVDLALLLHFADRWACQRAKTVRR